MTPKQINNKKTKIINKIDYWANQYRELQSECTHEYKESIYKSDTGNYDPSEDCYWMEHACPDCGKKWREEK